MTIKQTLKNKNKTYELRNSHLPQGQQPNKVPYSKIQTVEIEDKITIEDNNQILRNNVEIE